MTASAFELAAAQFLSLDRIAVAGVSRSGKATGNALLKALRDRGVTVFPLNPHAEKIDGLPCYPDLRSIPGGVEGVLIVTRPEAAAEIMQDAAASGVRFAWMHDNTLLQGSVSEAGIETGRSAGMRVIAGGCPLMFLDFSHKCMRWMLSAFGRMPPRLINLEEGG